MFDAFWHKSLKRPYRLYSESRGKASNPTIVLLHGIAASSADWHHLVDLLEPDFHIITIDLLGFGKSPKPQWAAYTMQDHLRSLRYTLKQLPTRRHYMLIGHSLGSLLATSYTRAYPRHISRLILLSPPVYPPLDSITSKLTRSRTSLFLNIYQFLRTNPLMTPENFRRLSYLLPLPKTVIKDPQTWTPFMRTLKECIETQTIMEDIRTIEAPIDVFYGTLDQVVFSDNIQLLEKAKSFTPHPLAVKHLVSRRYATAVAQFLSPTNEK